MAKEKIRLIFRFVGKLWDDKTMAVIKWTEELRAKRFIKYRLFSVKVQKSKVRNGFTFMLFSHMR